MDKKWDPNISIISHPQEPDNLLAINSKDKKNYKISKKEFIKILKNKINLNNIFNKDRDINNLKNEDLWIERNWQNSYHLYLFSRDIKYEDLHELNNNIRKNYVIKKQQSIPFPNSMELNGNKIYLTKSTSIKDASLKESFLNRRTKNIFSKQKLSFEDFSIITYLSTERIRQTNEKRKNTNNETSYFISYGSAFLIYISVYDVENIKCGNYFYDIDEHSLIEISTNEDNLRKKINSIINGNVASLSASFTAHIIADLEKYMWVYQHERAIRNLFIDAGKLNQYFIMAASAFKLDTFPTPAYKHSLIIEMLKLNNQKYQPLHSFSCGIRKITETKENKNA